MRDLDWWGIGKLSLKIPFYQWRTFVAALLPSLVTFALCYGAMEIIGGFLPNGYFAGTIRDSAESVTEAVAMIVFEWCWMTALWHNTMRHLITFPAHRHFWVYAAVSASISIIFSWLPASALFDLPREYSWQGLAERGHYIAIPFYIAVSLLCFALFWISLRLTIWPASIIVQRKWVSPIRVWNVTNGFAWDFFLIVMVTFVPGIVVGGTIFGGLAYFLPEALRSLGLDAGFMAIGFYVGATYCASHLLVYAEIFDRNEPAQQTPAASHP